MKKMRFLAAMLTVILTAGAMLSGCGKKDETAGVATQDVEITEENGRKIKGNVYLEGYPAVKEKVTLSVMTSKLVYLDSYDNMPILNEIEEKTNIDIDWQETPADTAAEKLNVTLASGTYPDMVFGGFNYTKIMEYSETGEILPLNPYLEQFAPRWYEELQHNDRARKKITDDSGNIYSLPLIREELYESGIRDAQFINKKWLDKLGLDMPTDVNELFDVLKAFVENDCNGNGKADEIGWSFQADAQVSGQFDIMSYFGVCENGSYLYVDNGVVKPTFTEEGYKEAIRFMRKMYEAGLIDPESFTQNNAQIRAKIAADPPVLGFLSAYSHDTESGDYVQLPPIKGANGETPLMRTQINDIQPNMLTIFKTNKSPEATMRWANELAEPYNAVRMAYGNAIRLLEDGSFEQYTDPVAEAEYQKTGMAKHPSSTLPFILTEETAARFTTPPNEVRKSYYDVMKDYICPKDYVLDQGMFYPEEMQKVKADYWGDIQTHIKKTMARWVVQGGMDEEWDKFMKELEDLHLSEVINAHQVALDSFKAK